MIPLSETETKLPVLLDDNLVLFRTAKGDRYGQQKLRLMIVGRALRCAGKSILDADFSWIKPYFERAHGLTKSSFWNTGGKFFSALTHAALEDDWYENIIWTNLFRIVPKTERNPSKRLADRQKSLCLQAHKEDLEAYRPTHILYMTGWDWICDFQTGLMGMVESHGIIGDSMIVVLPHPQGKPRNTCVNDAIRAIKRMGDEGCKF